LVAPNPVTNEEFGKVISGISHTPYWLPVPAAVLKLGLGEMSTLVLDGQYVIPDRLLKANYQFEFSTIKEALTDLFKS
jgi:NAD dependent epimerase/dehydratase family enzyme